MGKTIRISRRTLLRSATASIALPLLDVMQTSASETTGLARSDTRVAYLYIPNGVAEGAWEPAKSGRNGQLLELNKWMAPLEAYKQDLIIPRNMWTPQGNGHAAGTATWLTGGSYDGGRINAGGVSVDQVAARTIGRETMLPSLELSLEGEGHFSNDLPRNSLSWTAETTPACRDTEPQVIFDRLFRSGRSGLTKRSVLDSVLEETNALRRRASSADQRKLTEYFEALRAIEKRIEYADRQSREATKEGLLTDSLQRPAPGIPTDHQEYVRTMLDLVALAFWANATRVATFMLDHGQSNRYFNFIPGVQGTWHALSHYKDASGKTEDDDGMTSWSSVSSKRDMYNAVTRWHNEQVAYFLGKLKSMDDGSGSLLEKSMVVYGSSIADGHEHQEDNLPLLIAGGGGGTIHSGRVVKYRREASMSDLHLAVLKRLGVKVRRFADSETPMEELLT